MPQELGDIFTLKCSRKLRSEIIMSHVRKWNEAKKSGGKLSPEEGIRHISESMQENTIHVDKLKSAVEDSPLYFKNWLEELKNIE